MEYREQQDIKKEYRRKRVFTILFSLVMICVYVWSSYYTTNLVFLLGVLMSIIIISYVVKIDTILDKCNDVKIYNKLAKIYIKPIYMVVGALQLLTYTVSAIYVII